MTSVDWRTWLFIALLIFVGVGLIYLAFDPATEGEHAPPWVIAASGAVFAVAGLAVLVDVLPELRASPELKGRLHGGLGFVIILLFALIANWIAFGPGERSGEVTFALPLFGFSTGGDWLLRAPFACSAVFMNVLVILLVVRGLRGALRRKG